jgi:hypothetical protein
MVREQNVEVIAMLTGIEEKGVVCDYSWILYVATGVYRM